MPRNKSKAAKELKAWRKKYPDYVTKIYLPDKNKYKSYIDKIYDNGWVTNQGPLVKELELRLAKHLGVKNIILVANGTVALEIAYRALGIVGEAITTPFSFVATTSSLVSNGIKPIFADIDKDTPKSTTLYTKMCNLTLICLFL